jgi:hypothetical protein
MLNRVAEKGKDSNSHPTKLSNLNHSSLVVVMQALYQGSTEGCQSCRDRPRLNSFMSDVAGRGVFDVSRGSIHDC